MGRAGGAIPILFGIVIEGCMVGMLALGDLGEHIPAFFLLFGVASGAYLGALLLREDLSLWLVWVFAVVFRVTLLLTDPSLSDDIYRYLWDGRVFGEGINPYCYPPASNHLSFLRDVAIYPLINHPTLPTIYPPVSQYFFWVAHLVFDTVWGLKAMIVGADLMVGVLLTKLLRRKGFPPQALIIYLWHPLVVFESAASGHIDFLGILGIFLALWLWYKKRDGLAMVVLGGAILSKFLPVVMLPALLRWAKGWIPQNWKAFVYLPMTLLLGYLPFLLLEGGIWGSLGVYAEHWVFNSPLFWGLSVLVGDGVLVRQLIGVIFCLLILFVCLRRVSPLQAGVVLFSGFAFLTPTLHPWYVVWLVPFLVFSQNLALTGFSLAVVSSYHVQIGYRSHGIWEESVWVWIFEYGVLILLGLGTLIINRKFRYGKS